MTSDSGKPDSAREGVDSTPVAKALTRDAAAARAQTLALTIGARTTFAGARRGRAATRTNGNAFAAFCDRAARRWSVGEPRASNSALHREGILNARGGSRTRATLALMNGAWPSRSARRGPAWLGGEQDEHQMPARRLRPCRSNVVGGAHEGGRKAGAAAITKVNATSTRMQRASTWRASRRHFFNASR